MPLLFETNEGQAHAAASLVAQGQGYRMMLSDESVRMRLEGTHDPSVVTMRFAGAAAAAALAPDGPTGTVINYYMGDNPARWVEGVTTHERARYTGLYPGIDAVMYARDRALEYDFLVAPGADPALIRLRFDGVRSLELSRQGDLLVRTAAGTLTQRAPIAYQEVDGKRLSVSSAFTILGRRSVGFSLGHYDRMIPLVIDPVVVFSTFLGGTQEDMARSLEVDASGNSYLYGYTESMDFPADPGAQQATDPDASTTADAFVARFRADGTADYVTYLGGSDEDGPPGMPQRRLIGADPLGNVVVAGSTFSTDFPTLNAYDATHAGAGEEDGYVTKLSPTGQIVYSTYLGGDEPGEFDPTRASPCDTDGCPVGDPDEGIFALDVDDSGRAFVAGATESEDFPVTPNAHDSTYNGGDGDAFVAGFSANGTPLYVTYLGGRLPSGNATTTTGGSSAVCCFTFTYTLLTWTARQTGPAGENITVFLDNPGAADQPLSVDVTGTDITVSLATDAGGVVTSSRADIVNAVNSDPAASALVRISAPPPPDPSWDSTPMEEGPRQLLLPNTEGDELARSIATDGSGRAFVTGTTESSDFPTLNAEQPAHGGGTGETFVTAFNLDGTLRYSTFLGSYDQESPAGIAVDPSGNAHVLGSMGDSPTGSVDEFPLVNAADSTCADNTTLPGEDEDKIEAFVAKYDLNGNAVYITCLGGDDSEAAKAIAVDAAGNAHVTGRTDSIDFPLQAPFDTTNADPADGDQDEEPSDAFVTKFGPTGNIVFSTYLGGDGHEVGFGVATDASGNTYVTGRSTVTDSLDFPTTPDTLVPHRGSAAFVTVFNPSGVPITSSYVDGGGGQEGQQIAADGSGGVWIMGVHENDNCDTPGSLDEPNTPSIFPLENAYDANDDGCGGEDEAFLTSLRVAGITPPPPPPPPSGGGGGGPPQPGPPPACSDGVDNDNDGARDFPADDGCTSASDETETPDASPSPSPTVSPSPTASPTVDPSPSPTASPSVSPSPSPTLAPPALDLSPEEADNQLPGETDHEVVASVLGETRTGVEIDFFVISGPDLSTGISPFASCVTGADGTCAVTLTSIGRPGTDFVCGWLDTDGDSVFDPAGADEDGGDCDTEPLAEEEAVDGTDVVMKKWLEEVIEKAKVTSQVGIRFRDDRFRGKVKATDLETPTGQGVRPRQPRINLTSCEKGRIVKLKRVKPGKDKVVGKDRSNRRGKWVIKHPDPDGTYYAVVKRKKFTTRKGIRVVCRVDRSRKVTLRPPRQ